MILINSSHEPWPSMFSMTHCFCSKSSSTKLNGNFRARKRSCDVTDAWLAFAALPLNTKMCLHSYCLYHRIYVWSLILFTDCPKIWIDWREVRCFINHSLHADLVWTETERSTYWQQGLYWLGTDLLPQDLVESRSREIGYYNNGTALKLGRHLDSAAVEVPVKSQSDWKSLNPNLAASRLHDILR